jgi:membrane-bound lytic murein transglycosylase D
MIAKLRMFLVSMGCGYVVCQLCRGDERARRRKSTDVRSKLEFIIGTPPARALQWRENRMDVHNRHAACAKAALLLALCFGPVAAADARSSGPQRAGQAPSLSSRDARTPQQPAAQPPSPLEQQVIAAAERAYSSGIRNYHAGDLAAAKRDFDSAVDSMLSSGLDLKANPQLSDEFERIVDAVNALEMDALKQGNGFAPPTEQTPVDVANDVTFPVDPNIRAAAEAELKTTQSDLPLVINDAVTSYIGYFSNTSTGRGTIINSLRRAGRYKDLIQQTLRDEGDPQDLIYQAIAESGFQTQAVNARSGAAGMWQFMPFRGAYGLERNGWVDERFDPEKATRAYAREIKKNYQQFGDWYLAMAAYDWGAGNVQRAVQRTGYADFWELYKRNNLPRETKNYVPIILAAAVMAKNPVQYGLTDIHPDPPAASDTVTVNGSVDLRLAADIVNVPVQEIVGLNPSLLRMQTPPDEPYDLHLPTATKATFMETIQEIPADKRTAWRYRRVQPDDTLVSLARTYHVSTADIAFVNQLDPTGDISGEDALIIPALPPAASSGARSSARYKVEREDTLVTLADRFNVTTEQLRRWNHLRSSTIKPGQTLFVAEPAHVSASARGKRGRRGRAGAVGHASLNASSRAKKSAHPAETKPKSTRK